MVPQKKTDDSWDEDEGEGTRGPEPKRLKSKETPEELARRVLRAGKPQPGEIIQDEIGEDDEGY